MALGARRARLPVSSQCTLWIDPLAVLLFGKTDASGGFALSGPVPNQPSLVGSSVTATGFVDDPLGGFAGSLTISNRLHVVIGN